MWPELEVKSRPEYEAIVDMWLFGGRGGGGGYK